MLVPSLEQRNLLLLRYSFQGEIKRGCLRGGGAGNQGRPQCGPLDRGAESQWGSRGIDSENS